MIPHGVLKPLLIIAFATIVFSLGKALYHLMHDGASSSKPLQALTWRIYLSVGLIVVLIVGEWLGFIAPRSMPQKTDVIGDGH